MIIIIIYYYILIKNNIINKNFGKHLHQKTFILFRRLAIVFSRDVTSLRLRPRGGIQIYDTALRAVQLSPY